tara:strand:+ start:803 stop:1906 length:1104 start_codon:yes stop_codon:yes gene_type:complete
MAQVSDFNIENNTGAQVRQDINLVLEAIKTNSSGSSDPANPEAFMFYGDSSDNNIKIRNSQNNTFTTIGNVNETNLGLLAANGTSSMTGALKISDGSEGSPSLVFNTDTDTGFYKNSANSIGVSTGGTKRFTVGSYGIELRNGAQFEFRKNDNSNFTAFSASNSITENRTYTLPPAVIDGGFLKTNASGVLVFETIAGVPVGAIFCIAHTAIPSGYIECNGAAIPNGSGTVNGITANFAPLRALIGANLPDLRGEFVRGFDNGRGVDPGRSIGSGQGAQNQSHSHGANANATSNVNDPGHKHSSRGYGNQDDGGNQFTGSNNSDTRNNAINNANTGISVSTNVSVSVANEGGESRPRNVAMMYIIKF